MTITALPADTRPMFAAALTTATQVVEGIRPDQLTLPTPCDAYDVQTLLAHLLFAIDRAGVLGRGEDPMAAPEAATGLATDTSPAAWASTAERSIASWADDATLEQPIVLPWMQQPGAVALAMYVNEITVHTWDLAVATGQQPAWNTEALEIGFTAIQQILPAAGRIESFEAAFANIPEEFRRDASYPFKAAVDLSDDAPLIDRIVAWNGRTPA
jgi:uncharacterized protein (TIGR03086 family)